MVMETITALELEALEFDGPKDIPKSFGLVGSKRDLLCGRRRAYTLSRACLASIHISCIFALFPHSSLILPGFVSGVAGITTGHPLDTIRVKNAPARSFIDTDPSTDCTE
jgi:hypothetical protein